MKFIMSLLRKLAPKSYEERMNDYLGQATSREHFEHLEREWFKQNHVHYNPYYLLVTGVTRTKH